MLEVENMELAHRRAAIQIVAQLLETQADALLILEAARDFVLKFLAEDHLEEGRPGGRVVVARQLRCGHDRQRGSIINAELVLIPLQPAVHSAVAI